MLKNLKIITLFLSFVTCFSIFSQKLTTEQYIDKYYKIAVKEMKRSGIPASITLAQGILESGSGNSYLATKGKNHFGIKCHSWKGKTIYLDDDAPNECFRKYKNDEQSYIDHTDFLTSQSRYNFLFEYKTTDYKKWARGLKKAGYATSPSYATKLIGIIEKHKLYKYDKGGKPPQDDKQKKHMELGDDEEFTVMIGDRRVKQRNRIDYIVVKKGDTYKSLTRELELLRWELSRYNSIPRDTKLKPGQILYLQPKRNKAEFGKTHHVVEKGETMWEISQKYGIKMKKLYKKNLMKPGGKPEPGQELNLRKNKKEEGQGFFQRLF